MGVKILLVSVTLFFYNAIVGALRPLTRFRKKKLNQLYSDEKEIEGLVISLGPTDKPQVLGLSPFDQGFCLRFSSYAGCR